MIVTDEAAADQGSYKLQLHSNILFLKNGIMYFLNIVHVYQNTEKLI